LYIVVNIVVIICTTILFFLFSRVKNVRNRVIKFLSGEKLHDEMRLLYSQKEAVFREKEHIEKNIKRFLLIILIGCFLSTLIIIRADINPVLEGGNRIKREGFEGEKRNVTVYLLSENSDKKIPINIMVSNMKYSPEEIEDKSELLIRLIEKEITGKNSSTDYINSSMNLPKRIEGYPFEISWKSDNPLIIDRSGDINFEKLEKELESTGEDSVITSLTASIKYEDYQKDIKIPVRIFLPEKSPEEELMKAVNETISEIDKSTRDADEIILPHTVNGIGLSYSEEANYTAVSILVLSIVTAVCIYISSNSEINKEVKKRNEQMEMDYPRIINRYALYYSAGMHTKAVWKAICSDYRKQVSRNGERRYAFEEMLRAEAAMADGVGDLSVYNEFASNCGIRKYRHFVSLIEQSLKKGKEQMGDIMLKEADDAVNERLNMAKIKGEEAGTKLLLPMFLMLLVVLIIVIVPAVVNLNV